MRPISESQRRELSKDGSRALVRAVRNVTGHHPNDVMLGLLKHWAARSGEVRLKILYGRDNLWFRYHQDRVDPDQRVAASASRHAFQEDREKTGYYWSSTNPAADSQVRLAPGTIESLLPTFSQLMDSVL